MKTKLLGLCAGIVLSAGAANASTYDISITLGPDGSGVLTGTIDLDTSTGLFNALDLSGGCIITGDPGSCKFQVTRTVHTEISTPSSTAYQYSFLNGFSNLTGTTEGYDLASQAYSFFFGGDAEGELSLDISLQAGTIFAGYTDDACFGPNCPPISGGAGGTITAATPLPTSLPLFAFGLFTLLYWNRKIIDSHYSHRSRQTPA